MEKIHKITLSYLCSSLLCSTSFSSSRSTGCGAYVPPAAPPPAAPSSWFRGEKQPPPPAASAAPLSWFRGEKQPPPPAVPADPKAPLRWFGGEKQPPRPAVPADPKAPLRWFGGEKQPPRPAVPADPKAPLSWFRGEKQPPRPAVPADPKAPLRWFGGEAQPPRPAVLADPKASLSWFRGEKQPPRPAVLADPKASLSLVGGEVQPPRPTKVRTVPATDKSRPLAPRVMLRKPCYQQLQWAQNLIDFMEEYGSHFSSGVFSGSLRLPGEEITFQSGGDYSLPFHFTLEHFLKEIDVNFTACHVGKFKGCPPCKSGVEHVIGDHLPDSAVPKSAFNLSAIVTLFNPDAITRLEFSRFSPETFQWQSSVLYLFLRSCLLHYTIVQIEECHGLSGSSEFVFYVELPKNIGWVNKRFTEDGSKFFTNHTKFVKLIFGLDETKGKLFFYSAYPISMDKFQTAVSGGSAAADEEEEY